jgi:hypothetical protein
MTNTSEFRSITCGKRGYRNMSRGGIGGALLVLILATSSLAYTLLDLGMGSQMFQGSARCAGMGEVSLLCEDSPLAVALNPSLLARSNERQITGSYRFMVVEGDWSLPVHDSFDALLGYEVYSNNLNVYHNGDLSFSTGTIPRAANLAFGIAYLPAYDFNYDFSQEVRDRNTQSEPLDKVIANAFVESDGVVHGLSVGVAGGYRKRLFVGFGIDYLFGEYDMAARLANMDPAKLPCWEDAPQETSESFSASDLDGMRYRLGAVYVVNKRIELAATLTSETDLEGEYTTSGGFVGFSPWKEGTGESFGLKYPASYAFGISYRPRNDLRTIVAADVRYTRWSDAENEALEELALDDIYEWFIGVEHLFYHDRPLWFGFLYRPSPADKEAAESSVTAGTGIVVWGLDVDFSIRVGWRKYREFALFDDAIFCAQSREFSDLVEETFTGGVITLSKRF